MKKLFVFIIILCGGILIACSQSELSDYLIVISDEIVAGFEENIREILGVDFVLADGHSAYLRGMENPEYGRFYWRYLDLLGELDFERFTATAYARGYIPPSGRSAFIMYRGGNHYLYIDVGSVDDWFDNLVLTEQSYRAYNISLLQ